MNGQAQWAKQTPMVWQTLNAFHLVQEVVRAAGRGLLARGIRVNVDVPRTATLQADVQLMRHALRELVQCAVDAMPNGGELAITVWQDSNAIELEVADSRAQAMWRDRSAGSCLQLPDAVQTAAQAHGGQLTVANCPEGGMAVTMRLPAIALRAAA